MVVGNVRGGMGRSDGKSGHAMLCEVPLALSMVRNSMAYISFVSMAASSLRSLPLKIRRARARP